MTVVNGPTAFLFVNGQAIFFNDKERQMEKLQFRGWRGLHKFHDKYPKATVYIQGNPIDQTVIECFLKNIKK